METNDETSRPLDDDRASPDRRGFLKLGGLTIGFGALAAACVYPDKPVEKMAQTGTIPTIPATLVPPNPGSPLLDATLILTALSLELLAVETYGVAVSKGWLVTPVVADIARAFQDNHDQHAQRLVELATELGQDASAVKANAIVHEEVVKPELDIIASETADKAKAELDTLTMLLGLEDATTQMSAKAGGTLTTPGLRAAIMTIGASDARQYATIAGLIGNPAVPFSFTPTTASSVPADAMVVGNEKTLRPATASTGVDTDAGGTTTTTRR